MVARYNISLICSWIIAPALLHLARESVLYVLYERSLVERTTQLRTMRCNASPNTLSSCRVVPFCHVSDIQNESKVGSSLDGEQQQDGEQNRLIILCECDRDVTCFETSLAKFHDRKNAKRSYVFFIHTRVLAI